MKECQVTLVCSMCRAPVMVVSIIEGIKEMMIPCCSACLDAERHDSMQEGHDNGVSLGYDHGFNEGYDRGYADAMKHIEEEAYAQGREDGYQAGYEDGYRDGCMERV